MIAAPWDKVPPRDQLFVLVTGANSGVGLGICERLIDDFLSTRPLTSHLILIPTTRSIRKSRETISSLKVHLHRTASTSTALRSRSGPDYHPDDTTSRIHLLSVQLDLCDLPSIYACATTLVAGHVSDPTDPPNSYPYSIPRLDSVIFNAGFGGWTGLDWTGFLTTLFTKGLLSVLTWPTFKLARPGAVLNQRRPLRSDLVSSEPPQKPALAYASAYDSKTSSPVLGEVFSANIFGHYILAHELLPLLSRASPDETPGRIVWTSSIEPRASHFRLDDFQGLETEAPYESSKRLTDVLVLTSHLCSTQRISKSYFTPEDEDTAQRLPVRPSFYLTHPGVVASNLFPVPFPFILFWAYKFALYLARWFGSPWHPVTWYGGAVAPVWITLQDDETLKELDAKRIKWGSAASVTGRLEVKKTEVEGWGWEGAMEDRESRARDPATGVLRKVVGRHPGAKDLTKDQLVEFEELGCKVWAEMERLRRQWEDFLHIRGDTAQTIGEE